MIIRKFLLMMCMMLLSIASASAQSHTITRKSNNNNSTVSKLPPTRPPSSGKKATNGSTGKKTDAAAFSGKQNTGNTSEKKTSTATMQSEETSSSRITEPAFFTSCPDSNHPHAIDLGLPSGTKWACCNVGAAKPEDYGDFYAWGETWEKTTYNWSTYIHCGTKSTCYNLGSDIAATQYDVAHVKWGEAWVMPSSKQQGELLDNCTSIWTTYKNVKGRKFTGKNGKAIFLPAAGCRLDNNLDYAGSLGCYWSSTQYPSRSYNAYCIGFGSDSADWYDFDRSGGFSVRSVSR